ncbi:MAG: hypothetical protein U1U88_001262 [Lawsonella clevelandensis]
MAPKDSAPPWFSAPASLSSQTPTLRRLRPPQPCYWSLHDRLRCRHGLRPPRRRHTPNRRDFLGRGAWPWLFLINVPLGLICILGTLAAVPNTYKTLRAEGTTAQGKADYLTIVYTVISLFAINYAILYGPQRGWAAGGPSSLHPRYYRHGYHDLAASARVTMPC